MDEQFSLFGGIDKTPIPVKIGHKSKYQIFKQNNRYRKSDSSFNCGNCVSLRVFEYHDKKYRKCEKLGISNSEATDIRKGHICDRHNIAKEGNNQK